MMQKISQWPAIMTLALALALLANPASAQDSDEYWKAELANFDWANETSTFTDDLGGVFKIRVSDASSCETTFRQDGKIVNFAFLESTDQRPALIVDGPAEWLANQQGAFYRVVIVRERPGELSNLLHSTVKMKPQAIESGQNVLVGFGERLGIEQLAYAGFMMISPVRDGDVELKSEDGVIQMGAMLLSFSPEGAAGAAYASSQCIDHLKSQPVGALAENSEGLDK